MNKIPEPNAIVCYDCGHVQLIKCKRHRNTLDGRSCEKCGGVRAIPTYVGIDLSPNAQATR